MTLSKADQLPFTTYVADPIRGLYEKTIKTAQLLEQMNIVDSDSGLFNIYQALNRKTNTGKVIALKGDIERVDQFLHPIYYKGIEYIDTRPYTNKEGEVRDHYNHNNMLKRAMFDSLWIDERDDFYTISRFVIDAFSTWFSFGVQRNLNLSIQSSANVRVVAAIYMLSLFTTDKHMSDDETMARILRYIPQTIALPAVVVKELIDTHPTLILDMFRLERPCISTITHVVSVITNEDLLINKGMIYNSLCRGAVMFSNGAEITSIGLEHPPTFIIMLASSLGSKTSLGLSTVGIQRRNDVHGFNKFMEVFTDFKQIK